MFNTLYIIWFLFPLCFICLVLWSLLKPIFGVKGKEDTGHYFKQSVFCLLGFGIAVAIDSWEPFDATIDAISMGYIDISIARFLLYPAVLVSGAILHGKFFGTDGRVRHQNRGSR